jgi:putative flavoprotein involved in K+ transport
VRPDAVISATGFSPGLGPLVGHLGVLDERGIPLVSGGETHPDAPGLHFAALQPRLSGLLREAARDAARVADAITSGTARTGPE